MILWMILIRIYRIRWLSCLAYLCNRFGYFFFSFRKFLFLLLKCMLSEVEKQVVWRQQFRRRLGETGYDKKTLSRWHCLPDGFQEFLEFCWHTCVLTFIIFTGKRSCEKIFISLAVNYEQLGWHFFAFVFYKFRVYVLYSVRFRFWNNTNTKVPEAKYARIVVVWVATRLYIIE